MEYKIIKNKKGFSIMEIVVASSVFFIMLVMAINTFFYVNKVQKNIIVYYDIQNGFQNSINKMMSDVEDNVLDYNMYPMINNPVHTLYLTKDNEQIIYRLNNKSLEVSTDSGINYFKLNDIKTNEIESLNFYITKDSWNNIFIITTNIGGNYINQYKERKPYKYQFTIEQKLYLQ